MSTPPPRGYVFAATDLTQSRLRGLTRVVKELPPWGNRWSRTCTISSSPPPSRHSPPGCSVCSSTPRASTLRRQSVLLGEDGPLRDHRDALDQADAHLHPLETLDRRGRHRSHR